MLLDPSRLLIDGGGGTAPVKKTPAIKSSPGPSDLAKLSPQFSNAKPVAPSPSIVDRALAIPAQFASNVISGIAGGFGVSTAARASGIKPPTAPKLDTKTAANITKTVAGELSGIAPAKRVLSNTSSPILGSKALGTGLDVLSAIPVVGSIGKGAAVSGALGKTAKEAGAIQAAGEAAKVAKQATAGKVGAAGAAAMIATSPAGHAADIVKPVTSISQSVEAGKLAKTAVKDVTASKAAKTTAKTSTQDVTFTPKAAQAKTAAEKASQSSNITKAALDVSAASKIGQFKAGTADHTKSDTKDVKDVKNVKDTVTSVKDVQNIKNTQNVKSNQSINKVKDTDALKKLKDSESKSTKKGSETVKTFNYDYDYNIKDPYIKPSKDPYESNKVTDTENTKDGGKKIEEPTKLPPRQFIPIVPTSKEIEELNRKRKWNPSAIV